MVGWRAHLRRRGFSASTPMDERIAAWRGWYLADNDWYSSVETDSHERRTYRVERQTIRPARMVCQEWASLLLNERTAVACDDGAADAALQAFVERSRFFDHGQGLIERTFALGTGAWALRIEGAIPGSPVSPDARAVAQRFDARGIIPLTYDEDDCTEAAFISKVTVRGVTLTQLQMHLASGAGRVIETVCFGADGKPVEAEGVAPEIAIPVSVPTFALVRPALDNPYWDYSPFGVSVFDDALGAVKLTDAALDNLYRDLWLGQKMLFLDERMMETGKDGKVRVPRERDQQLFRKAEMDPGGKMLEEYNPDLRVTDNRSALGAALGMLAARCGLGADYFGFGADGVTPSGLKTATEVVAEASDLYRNVRKHENALTPAIARILAAAVAAEAAVTGRGGPSVPASEIRVLYDDSVIEDTAALRRRDLEDVAAGLQQPYEYRMRWYSEDEATARAMTEAAGLPGAEF